MLAVSITHSRRTWQVNHVHSPAISFFRDNTSLQLANSIESQVQNTLSVVRNKVFRTRRYRWGFPWSIPSKS